MLSYCRELRVPLEVLVNDNRAALLQDDAAFGGEPQVARRVLADTRGGIAALAAGGLTPGARQSRPDRELRTLLQSFGALGDDLRYAGSVRAGFAEPPGLTPAQPGRRHPALPLAEIARAGSWPSAMASAETWDPSRRRARPGVLAGSEAGLGSRPRRGLRHLHHSPAGAQEHRVRLPEPPEAGHRRGRPRLHPGGQGSVPGQSTLVGNRPADLRGHQLDQPRYHPDLVSLGRAQR